MSAPLIERLREPAGLFGKSTLLLCREAASTIEAQAAEIERLKQEAYALRGDIADCMALLAAKDAAVQILLDIPLVCVTDAEIAHAKERRAAAIRASGKEG